MSDTTAAPVVDWVRAEQVAIKVAGRSGAPAVHVEGWDPRIGLIEQQIEDVTGLRSAAGTGSVELIDRPTWIRANIVSLRQLLDPVLSKLAGRRPTSGFAAGALNSWSQQMAGAELGMMLGWIGGRVLGQYDVLVRGDAADVGADGDVYLVGPNLATLEQRFGFDPIEFRTWVLVHELTHRFVDRVRISAVPPTAAIAASDHVDR
jgi:putative hydrolase